MVEMDWRLLAAIFVAALLLLLALARRWAAWRRSVRAKRRGARAVRGEVAAERLLERAGYTIVDRQLGLTWQIECDGETLDFLLRADLLVERGGEQFIAEVKTGELAPSLGNASTRRQMLEYSVAFNSPVILLVDVENERILEVRFPLPDVEAMQSL
ncbi:MAG: hypothetical protein GY811_09870 [Myxococcales bacterium]|nr:hypothetical protein [Myxococcales bacterium]